MKIGIGQLELGLVCIPLLAGLSRHILGNYMGPRATAGQTIITRSAELFEAMIGAFEAVVIGAISVGNGGRKHRQPPSKE